MAGMMDNRNESFARRMDREYWIGLMCAAVLLAAGRLIWLQVADLRQTDEPTATIRLRPGDQALYRTPDEGAGFGWQYIPALDRLVIGWRGGALRLNIHTLEFTLFMGDWTLIRLNGFARLEHDTGRRIECFDLWGKEPAGGFMHP